MLLSIEKRFDNTQKVRDEPLVAPARCVRGTDSDCLPNEARSGAIDGPRILF